MDNNKNNRPQPWITHPHIWKTESQFWAWVRGGLRQSLWNTYPVKIEFKNNNVSPPPEGYTGRAKSGAFCALSGEWVGKSKLQVDHKVGNVPLRSWDDLEPFIAHLLTEDYQLVSPEAHKIKSHAEKTGLTYEEAKLDKERVKFSGKKASEQKKILIELGFPEKLLTNKEKRVKLFKEYLEN